MIDQRNDTMSAALTFQLGLVTPADTNDMLVSYLQNLTLSVISDPNDLWHLYWDQQLIAPGDFNDRAHDWLNSLGHVESDLPAQWHAYWTANLPP